MELIFVSKRGVTTHVTVAKETSTSPFKCGRGLIFMLLYCHTCTCILTLAQ